MTAGLVASLLFLALAPGQPARTPAEVPAEAGEPSAADADAQRAQMIELVRIETLLTAPETGIEVIEPRVLAAMGEVPRHAFVPAPLASYAYLPQPLPVHPEQNIAAPFLVALMTHLAR